MVMNELGRCMYCVGEIQMVVNKVVAHGSSINYGVQIVRVIAGTSIALSTQLQMRMLMD